MANTRELRRRIRSVKNTSQITKAMQMVSATKMRRAQAQALSGRPYNLALNFSLHELLTKIDASSHPLLRSNESSENAFLLLSTNRSLCGSLNTNLFRALLTKLKDFSKVRFFTVGKKARQFVIRTGKELIADFENLEVVTFRQARQTAKLLIDSFLKGEIGEVYLAYPDFISTLRQEPKITKILPIDPRELKVALGDLTNKPESETTRKTSAQENAGEEFIFEPNPDSLLDYVLNHFVETKIYQALLETKASEHSARMIAMQNATDNAKELVEDLTLSYNQTRQAAITNELLEITSAQAALE